MEQPRRIRRWKQARIFSQTFFFLAFLFLLARTEYHGRDVIAYPVRLFLEIDPLILITSWLSSHQAATALYWSLLVLVPTFVLGRFFCGWICPLGALNDAVSSRAGGRASVEAKWERGGRRFKYYVLLFLLAGSALSVQLVGFLDPISLVIRSFTLALSPALNFLVHGMFSTAYRVDLGGLGEVLDSLYGFLRRNVVSFGTPVFRQGSLLGLLFLAVLGANYVRKRFWCRFLCPLGALLALASRYSLLNHRVEDERCDSCRACLATCSGGAKPAPGMEWMGSECVLCLNCHSTCDRHAVSFTLGRPRPDLRRTDLERRYLLSSFVAGGGCLAFLRLSPRRRTGNALLIRPPGARDESSFLSRCVKCGECMKVCITNGLQPTFLQAGLEGMWSPVLVPRIGYCEYNCTLCGQVCPTGAIEKLDVEVKRKRKIGLAFIDQNRCLPYAFATECIVCEEHCPTSPKAILFRQEKVQTHTGEVELKLPVVDPKVCTGCGICEYKCPVGEEAAIRVSSIGEERSLENRLFLD